MHLTLIAALASTFLSSVAEDSIVVRSIATAPRLDGAVSLAEYGAAFHELNTAGGIARIWVARHGGYVYVAAVLPDSSFYWGDDFVVSVDPDGSGGAAPQLGDRQWYLRRTLDSSVVSTSPGGRWWLAGAEPSALGARRRDSDWEVAASDHGSSWSIELQIRESAIRTSDRTPRIAFRTYNDAPPGWWSWPPPPDGMRPSRVEHTPNLWIALRFE